MACRGLGMTLGDLPGHRNLPAYTLIVQSFTWERSVVGPRPSGAFSSAEQWDVMHCAGAETAGGGEGGRASYVQHMQGLDSQRLGHMGGTRACWVSTAFHSPLKSNHTHTLTVSG